MSKWKYPGQYEFDGLVLSGAIPKSEVIRLRDELELYAGDVATASCCRTGMWGPTQSLVEHHGPILLIRINFIRGMGK